MLDNTNPKGGPDITAAHFMNFSCAMFSLDFPRVTHPVGLFWNGTRFLVWDQHTTLPNTELQLAWPTVHNNDDDNGVRTRTLAPRFSVRYQGKVQIWVVPPLD